MDAVTDLSSRRVLLIVSGGIAAYKALELIRLLRGRGCGVGCVLTEAGAQFVTPLSLQALSESKVYTDLFSLTDESEMGHIQLSRSADLVVVAPASADILAKMAAGPCGRSGLHIAAGHRQAGAGRAGDECSDVAARGDAGEHGAARCARHPCRGAGRGCDGVQRIRSWPACRTTGDPGGDRGTARPGGAACREACVGHQRTDARADRSGALHRQPLQRTAGSCDRSGPRGTGGPRDVGQRAGVGARSCRCRHHACGKRAADAGRLSVGAAGGRRDLRCRGRRLAGGRCRFRQDQEGAWCGATCAGTRGQSRHSGHHRAARSAASAAGHRICRGDGRSDGECAGQTSSARTPTGSSPTTCRRPPASWVARRTWCI